jgi:tetratricopeptide (TPR) repeat protein
VREAADLAEQVGDEGVALAAAAGLALVAWCEGRVHDAIAVGRRALPTEPEDLMLGSEYWWPAPVVWLTGFTRCHEGWAGRPSEGLAGLERPFELARSQGSVLAELILCLWAITLAELLGDAACAMVHARRLRKTSEMFDKPEAASSLIHLMIGVAHQLAGESREAAGCLERAVAIEEDTGGGPTDVSISWSRLAVAYADLGQSERALEMAVRGLELVRQRQFPVGVTMALTMQSQVLRKTQGADARVAIESALTEAEALVARTGIRSWQPFIHVERAELARLLGDQAGCEGEFREAHRLFTEMSAIGHADRIAEQLRR